MKSYLARKLYDHDHDEKTPYTAVKVYKAEDVEELKRERDNANQQISIMRQERLELERKIEKLQSDRTWLTGNFFNNALTPEDIEHMVGIVDRNGEK